MIRLRLWFPVFTVVRVWGSRVRDRVIVKTFGIPWFPAGTNLRIRKIPVVPRILD